MTNEDFQAKLLNNINMALQSVHVNAPTPASINAEAVLDGLVKNILEATEKDPSFDRIIQEVVGQDMPPAEPLQTGSTSVCIPDPAPQPPQTPLIIRTAVASANASNGTADGNAGNGNGNAIIQLNANNSIGTLIDPNFSISKLIVLNSNESAQKQQLLQPPTVNLSFSSENLINFVEGAGGNLTEADAVANAAAVAAASGSQVCVDATNGQLTFPMILSNEGLLSHLPFLVNNEWLAQQLRSDAFANADVSHIEIPLPEPITVTANQLPPNSIIINSAVKQPPPPATAEPPAQLIADPPKPTASTVANAAQLERSSGKVTSCNAVPASLDSSRLVLERLTPSTSGIVNVKAFRSLSTPRKRTSHVRTLNFSPKAVPQVPNTPVSTRRLQQQQQRQQRLQQKHKAQQEAKTVEEAKPKELKADEQQQQPVCIKYVEILPNFGNRSASPTKPTGTAASVPATSASCADLSANESNGCVPPLFAMEEGSNQTVIKAVTASKQAKTRATAAAAAVAGDGSADATAAAMAPTPKRKQKRRAAAKACKRIISQTAVLDEANTESGNNKSQQEQSTKTEQQQQQQKDAKNTSTSLDDSKENKSVDSLMLEVLTDMDEDLMSAWQRQMHGTSTDLEQRLREINAKRQELMQSISRPRRNRVAGKKKSGTPLGPTQKKLPTVASARRKKRKLLQVKKSSNPDGEFKIKIKTPQKSKKPVAVSQEIKEPSEEVIVEKPNEIQEQKEAEKPQEDEEEEPKEASVIKSEESKEQAASEAAAEQREASLSMLFETPFKMTLTEAGEIPPTPGPALMPPLDTPYAKLLPSASFLFGSDTKSILDTPMLTAITPGMRLSTPFGHPLGTPHGSAAKTDYSSGSSYYRPDEAEHTDTNAQCALQPTPKHTRTTEERTESAKKSPPTTSFELHAERVPVEPMVLRRVRSFGTEAVDSAEGAVSLPANAEHALPLTETAHYKLVSGLPDAIVDNSSSSSSASSSTFSSSSSSSSSGSSSSDSSAASASAASASSQVPVNATPAKTMQLLDMQNLSDISSTEDEEWVKAAAASGDGPLDAPPLAIDSEPAQLVSQDGEVRYPLRNWLTPSKDAAAAAARAADLNTSGDMAPPAAPQPVVTTTKKSPAKSPTAAKIAQQAVMEQRRQDLAEVRERVKAKVKQQPLPRAKAKKLTTMRETAQLSNPNPNPKALNKSPKKESKVKQESKPEPEMKKPGAADPVKETSNPNKPTASTPSSELDPALLFALNLSAKKQQHHQHPAKVVRVAVEIAAQPAPLKGTGRPRGRPKKLPSAEPVKLAPDCTRRSSRLIDNKSKYHDYTEFH